MRALQYGITCALLCFAPACSRAVAADRSVGPEKTPIGVATLNAGAGDEPGPPAEKAAHAKVVAPAPAPTAELPSEPSACPEGMVLVEGEYCPEVEEKCLEWMDPPSSRYAHFRCARYEKPSKCIKPREHRRYCIDVTERKEEGSDLPRHFMSWTSSKALCESVGARLCRESEWIFACEGEEMRPYPYGWERDPTACNTDIFEGIGRPGALRDHRSAVGSHAKCASPFGVQDLAGNVEEWAQADGPGQGSKMGWKEVLKGSWWIPSRHACRQFQVGHNDVYNGAETGTRCCKDAPAK